jgi:hypothetical protein
MPALATTGPEMRELTERNPSRALEPAKFEQLPPHPGAVLFPRAMGFAT